MHKLKMRTKKLKDTLIIIRIIDYNAQSNKEPCSYERKSTHLQLTSIKW